MALTSDLTYVLARSCYINEKIEYLSLIDLYRFSFISQFD